MKKETRPIVPINLEALKTIYIENSILKPYISIDSMIDKPSVKFTALKTKGDGYKQGGNYFFHLRDANIAYDGIKGNFEYFDSDGRLLSSKSPLSHDPYTPLQPSDVRYDYNLKRLIINDSDSNFIIYDPVTGKTTYTRKNVFRYYQAQLFYPLGKDAYAAYNPFNPVAEAYENYRFYIVSSDKVVFKALPFGNLVDVAGKVSDAQFYKKKDTTRFFEPFFPVIYDVLNNGLKLRYHVKYATGNTSFASPDDSRVYVENYEKKLPVMLSVTETRKLVLVEFVINDRRYNSIYDLQTNTSLGTCYLGYRIQELGLNINTVFSEGDQNLAAFVPAGELMTIRARIGKKAHPSLLEKKLMDLQLKDTDSDILLSFNTLK